MSYESLIASARQIKTETADRANTALRVGGWMEEAVSFLKGELTEKAPMESERLLTSAKNLIDALNEVASNPNLQNDRIGELLAMIGELTDIVSEKADLVAGKVPAAQLPAYIDEVEEFANYASLPSTGSGAKIYVTKDNNKTYRWSGSAYVELSTGVALGETASTAYRGDRGKTAYEHTGRFDNPHKVTASQVGLGSVNNTSDMDKPISTATAVALANLSGLISDLAAAIREKTDLASTHTMFTRQYDPEHAGPNDYMKVLSCDASVPLALNVTGSAFGGTSNNAVWASGLASAYLLVLRKFNYVAVIEDGVLSLYMPTLKYNSQNLPSYTYQVVNGKDVVWHDHEYADLTAKRICGETIVMQSAPAPTIEGSRTFQVASGVGSVSLLDCSDFVGEVSDDTQRATVTVSNEEEGSVYRFTYTKGLPNGVTITNASGVVYCDITDPINAGDVITYTSVSNTKNGWLSAYQRALVTSSDQSVKVKNVDGVFDLHVDPFDLSQLARVALSGSSEDLTDEGYNVQTEVRVDLNGKIVGGAFYNSILSVLKNFRLMSREAFNSWVEEYKPASKSDDPVGELARVATTGSSEDLVDTGYCIYTKAGAIADYSDGHPIQTSGPIGGVKLLKNYRIVSTDYLDSWINKYTPYILGRAKEKKIYYVPNQTTWNIPSDAEIVILRRDDFPSDTDEMAQDYIDLYLPDGIQIGRQIHIIATNYSAVNQKPITLNVRATRGKNSEAGYYLRYLYQGSNIIFTYYGGSQDDYDGGWANK